MGYNQIDHMYNVDAEAPSQSLTFSVNEPLDSHQHFQF